VDSNNQQVDMTTESSGPGTVSRIFKVFFEPSKAFTGFAGKFEWIVPLLIIAIVGGILGYQVQPIFIEDRFEILQEKFADNPQVLEYIENSMEEARKHEFKWYFPVLALVVPFIFMAVIAALGLVIGNFVFGGKASFWTVMNVIAFAALVGLLGDIIRNVLMIAKNTSYIYTGLGILKPVDDGSFLFYLFRQIDVFSIWRIIVTAIGLGVVYNMKPKKFGYVLFGVWAVFILVVAILNATIFAGGLIY
jgi:hypothetical protein